MIRNINQSHYVPGAANLYNSWEWDQSSFFYRPTKPQDTHTVRWLLTQHCALNSSTNRKKRLQCTYFGRACARIAAQACLLTVDWVSGKADKAALQFAPEHCCNWVPRESGDASGEAPTVTALEWKTSEAADLAVLSNASEKGAMKITCFSFLVWNAHTGHFGFLRSAYFKSQSAT